MFNFGIKILTVKKYNTIADLLVRHDEDISKLKRFNRDVIKKLEAIDEELHPKYFGN